MKHRQSGNITIEAVLGFPIIIAIVFVWIEICYFSYALNFLDHKLFNAATTAKKYNISIKSDYKSILIKSLNEENNYFVDRVVKKENIKSEVYYYTSYESLVLRDNKINNKVNKSKVTSHNMPIAVYKLRYSYTPVLISFLGDIEIYREIIALQEKERSQFK